MPGSLNFCGFIDTFSGIGAIVNGRKGGMFVELGDILLLSFGEDSEIFRFKIGESLRNASKP